MLLRDDAGTTYREKERPHAAKVEAWFHSNWSLCEGVNAVHGRWSAMGGSVCADVGA